ncbi:unnamed protein product, partial [marine sediment metagenome]
PEAFTPDGVYYLGMAPEVDGCFVAAGFNSVGLQSAGGVGWVLADWIADRHAPMDLSAVDIRRAFPFQGNSEYLKERIPESLGLLYAMHWPFRQYESARNQRLSPIHDRIDTAGATFGEVAGWERPNWFALDGQERVYEYSYGKQNWFEASGVECDAVRNAVGFFDETCFVKLRVQGPDALTALNEICANEVDVPLGKAVYTQWCNDRGGIEADLTVTRLAEDEYFVVTAAVSGTRDAAWLREGCRDFRVTVTDVTLVTPANEVSTWTTHTEEQHRIAQRLLSLGIVIETGRTLASVAEDSVTTECVFTGDTRGIDASNVVIATSRKPQDDLFYELVDEINITRIGDCLAPGTIATSVYSGHRYARELDTEVLVPVPFIRE